MPHPRDITKLTKTLTMKNDVSEVARLSTFMKELTAGLGIDKSLAMHLRLAVEEAVVNVINYAYPSGRTGEIEVQAMFDGKSLKTVIRDTGVAFDPTQNADVDISQPVEARRIGGLGILLVRGLMDSVCYERTDGKNVLTLEKKI